jgi:large subunit ribosomal protein L4
MSEAQVFTAAAAEKGTVELPSEFSAEVNRAVLHAAVRAYLGNQRQGTHSTKTRGEVSGGGSKPWRQKGTGRARAGTTRAAHWRGGGVVFGPKPRDYRIDLPKKVRRNARASAFSARASEKAVNVIESFDFDTPSTKGLVQLLAKMDLSGKKVLLLTAGDLREVILSSRNLAKVKVMRFSDASAYDILWSNAVLIEQAALNGSTKKGEADA